VAIGRRGDAADDGERRNSDLSARKSYTEDGGWSTERAGSRWGSQELPLAGGSGRPVEESKLNAVAAFAEFRRELFMGRAETPTLSRTAVEG
jgi:hypothetical protein